MVYPINLEVNKFDKYAIEKKVSNQVIALKHFDCLLLYILNNMKWLERSINNWIVEFPSHDELPNTLKSCWTNINEHIHMQIQKQKNERILG